MMTSKKLLTASILLALPMAVSAADISIYGRAHVSVDFLDDGADYSEVALSSNSSRLGFRANEDFGTFSATVQVEQEIVYGESGGSFATRDTFLGLKGDFGSLRLGRFDTPFKRARGPANLFGDQVGDMRNLTKVGNARFDERTPNTLNYQTPTINGFGFNVSYSLHEGRDNSGTDDEALSTSVTYKAGALDLAAAYEKFADDASRGGRDAVRLAGAYKIEALTLAAFYQMADHDDDVSGSDVYGVGASYALSDQNLIKAQYFARSADVEESDSEMFAIGYEYRIRPPLRFYVNYAMVSNDDNIALTPWNQGRRTNQAGTLGETSSGLSLGVRYDF